MTEPTKEELEQAAKAAYGSVNVNSTDQHHFTLNRPESEGK